MQKSSMITAIVRTQRPDYGTTSTCCATGLQCRYKLPSSFVDMELWYLLYHLELGWTHEKWTSAHWKVCTHSKNLLLWFNSQVLGFAVREVQVFTTVNTLSIQKKYCNFPKPASWGLELDHRQCISRKMKTVLEQGPVQLQWAITITIIILIQFLFLSNVCVLESWQESNTLIAHKTACCTTYKNEYLLIKSWKPVSVRLQSLEKHRIKWEYKEQSSNQKATVPRKFINLYDDKIGIKSLND